MKKSGRIAGLLLVLAGSAFLIVEFGLFDEFGFSGDLPVPSRLSAAGLSATGLLQALAGAALSLWPLLLVAAGAAILFRNGTVSKVIWILVFSAVCIYAVLGSVFHSSGSMILERFGLTEFAIPWTGGSDGESDGDTGFVNIKEIEYTPELDEGEAVISLGACNLLLKNTEDKAAVIRSTIEGVRSDWTSGGGVLNLNIGEKDVIGSIGSGKRVTQILLGERLDWRLFIVTGASGTKLDLRELRVGWLEVEAGAGAVEAHFGDGPDVTKVRISGGAADIRIYIPMGSGVRIEKVSGLSGSNFEAAGLTEIETGVYESTGYADSANTIDIELSTGISNIRLIRE